MTDQEIIRKAVELLDGDHYFPTDTQWGLDALAAQLVRQVDALDRYAFGSDEAGWASVWDEMPSNFERIAIVDEDVDRTMNTLKCIVDSGVLEVDSGVLE